MKNYPDFYVHGYSDHELKRLRDQSQTLGELLHHDTRYHPGRLVLEAGCGIGAQTALLLKHSPGIHLISLDLSMKSLKKAQIEAGGSNSPASFLQADLFALPFADETFEDIFICFVLEHLPNPQDALQRLKAILRPGGTLTVIEGDHGSCFFTPNLEGARHVWNCLIEAQARLGGDSLIGRRLYPLLHEADFKQINVSPRFVYADPSRPAWVNGFTLKTICAMVEGIREKALEMGLTNDDRWKKGMEELRRTSESPQGVFCYTFFKGAAVK